jgi:hypothetical protein
VRKQIPAPVFVDTLEIAWGIADEVQVSHWDGLIIAAAIHQNCETLLSEDLQHGQIIEGVRIVNPFREAAHPEKNYASSFSTPAARTSPSKRLRSSVNHAASRGPGIGAGVILWAIIFARMSGLDTIGNIAA